jgi:hypothetical protein
LAARNINRFREADLCPGFIGLAALERDLTIEAV